MATERWMPVVGYEGHYEVSDQGRVRSLDRKDFKGRSIRGQIIAQGDNRTDGSKQIHLTLDGVRHTHAVHNLVLEAFVGPRPHRGAREHINGNRHDNRLINLRWGVAINPFTGLPVKELHHGRR